MSQSKLTILELKWIDQAWESACGIWYYNINVAALIFIMTALYVWEFENKWPFKPEPNISSRDKGRGRRLDSVPLEQFGHSTALLISRSVLFGCANFLCTCDVWEFSLISDALTSRFSQICVTRSRLELLFWNHERFGLVMTFVTRRKVWRWRDDAT